MLLEVVFTGGTLLVVAPFTNAGACANKPPISRKCRPAIIEIFFNNKIILRTLSVRVKKDLDSLEYQGGYRYSRPSLGQHVQILAGRAVGRFG